MREATCKHCGELIWLRPRQHDWEHLDGPSCRATTVAEPLRSTLDAFGYPDCDHERLETDATGHKSCPVCRRSFK